MVTKWHEKTVEESSVIFWSIEVRYFMAWATISGGLGSDNNINIWHVFWEALLLYYNFMQKPAWCVPAEDYMPVDYAEIPRPFISSQYLIWAYIP